MKAFLEILAMFHDWRAAVWSAKFQLYEDRDALMEGYCRVLRDFHERRYNRLCNYFHSLGNPK